MTKKLTEAEIKLVKVIAKIAYRRMRRAQMSDAQTPKTPPAHELASKPVGKKVRDE